VPYPSKQKEAYMQSVIDKDIQKIGHKVEVDSDTRYIGVIGSRSLPNNISEQVGEIVEDLLDRGFNISTGGAVGADEFCVAHLVHIGLADRATIFAPWKEYGGFPNKVRSLVRQFREYKGAIIWGPSSGNEAYSLVRAALLQRNVRLLEASYGVVAFLHGESKGSLFTISRAIKRHMPLVIFPIDRDLPKIPSVKWVPIRCGGCWEGSYKAVYLR
jgi:hypothetical protein